MAAIDEIVSKCRALLERHYGSRFKGLVLYGSVPVEAEQLEVRVSVEVRFEIEH
jgi:hypothetical protein